MDSIITVQDNNVPGRTWVYESFSSRPKSRTPITLRVHWNLAKLVKTCRGIIVLRLFVADIEELETLDASEVHDPRLKQKKCERKGEHFIPDRGGNSNIVWKRLWGPRIHSEAGTTETSEDLMGEIQGNSDPTDRNKSWRWAQHGSWSIEGDFI